MKCKYLVLFIFLFVFQACASLRESELRSELLIAKSYFREQNYKESVEKLDAILKQYPENEKALSLRAECYFNLEEYDKAHEDSLKLCELNPSSENLIHLSDVEYELKLLSNVIERCEKLINEGSLTGEMRFDCWNLLANSYSESDQNEKAIKYYNLMIEKTGAPEILVDRGISYFDMKQYDKALDDFSRVISETENKSEIYREQILTDDFYFYLGVSLYENEKYDEAAKYLNKIKDPKIRNQIEKKE